MILLILNIISLIIFFVYLKIEVINMGFIVKLFKKGNVIVWGKKRKGKDLLFQKVVNSRKREKYYSNYPLKYGYGYKGVQISLNELSVFPNTYDNVIQDKIIKIKEHKEREKADVYISDGGIHLPSQYNHILNKHYPSMPIYYAIIGHLYDSNIHVNYNGHLTRLWDKLREQADDFIKVVKNIKLPFIIFIKVRYYEEYNSAEQGLLPMKKGFMNKEQKALYQQYIATNGEIKHMWLAIRKRKIHYDTRYFRRLFFKEEAMEEVKI